MKLSNQFKFQMSAKQTTHTYPLMVRELLADTATAQRLVCLLSFSLKKLSTVFLFEFKVLILYCFRDVVD